MKQANGAAIEHSLKRFLEQNINMCFQLIRDVV